MNGSDPHGLVDAGNWREHDGVVHLLEEFLHETPYMRGESDVDYEQWSSFETPCGIRLPTTDGEPIYVKADITCVVCLAAEGEHGHG